MIPRSRFVLLAGLFLCVAAYAQTPRVMPAPLPQPLERFPAVLGQWRMVGQEFFNPALLASLQPTDYLFRRYQRASGDAVDLYIGYHDGGRGSGPIHSPKNCLPGSGWSEISAKPLSVSPDGQPITVMAAWYAKGMEKTLFVYWFATGERILTSEIGLKAAELANTVIHGRRNAAFVRISLPAGADEQADLAKASDFLNQAFADLRAALNC